MKRLSFLMAIALVNVIGNPGVDSSTKLSINQISDKGGINNWLYFIAAMVFILLIVAFISCKDKKGNTVDDKRW